MDKNPTQFCPNHPSREVWLGTAAPSVLHRGARLTPAGVAFVEDARGALGQTVRAALRARAQNISGQLRLAYSYLTPSHFTMVGDAIAQFHQACPELGV